jgi:hypothetical protein
MNIISVTKVIPGALTSMITLFIPFIIIGITYTTNQVNVDSIL